MLYRKIDNDGLFLEDVFIDHIPILTQPNYETITNEFGDTEEIYIGEAPLYDEFRNIMVNPNYIIDVCPEGFILPRWNGNEWTEGGVAPTETTIQEVERLKLELSETDYKIIKCSEYKLLGIELPYDMTELHSGRQAIRDRINELENM
jgi:hypothetical protein